MSNIPFVPDEFVVPGGLDGPMCEAAGGRFAADRPFDEINYR